MSVPVEKIEEVIAQLREWADNPRASHVTDQWQSGRSSAFADTAKFVARFLLPPPPLVIEPGRYRTRDGQKVMIAEVGENAVVGLRRMADGSWLYDEWSLDGRWSIERGSEHDLIAPWESDNAD